MNVKGTITNSIDVTGNVSVQGACYDNDNATVMATFRWTPAAGGKQQFCKQIIAGADVKALGPNWSDTDLLNWFVKQFGLTDLDAQQGA